MNRSNDKCQFEMKMKVDIEKNSGVIKKKKEKSSIITGMDVEVRRCGSFYKESTCTPSALGHIPSHLSIYTC